GLDVELTRPAVDGEFDHGASSFAMVVFETMTPRLFLLRTGIKCCMRCAAPIQEKIGHKRRKARKENLPFAKPCAFALN
ncbi:MAG: hypothetical protein WBM28_00595, partial [Burkholderiales bacterium]